MPDINLDSLFIVGLILASLLGKIFKKKEPAEKEKPTRAAGDRNSAEPDGGQASQTQMWKTRPVKKERYNRKYKGKEEWENATRDEPSTLWFIPQTDPFKVPAINTEEFERGPILYNHDEGEHGRKKEWRHSLAPPFLSGSLLSPLLSPLLF